MRERERTRQLGAKEMATRREVRCEIHCSQEKSRFQKNHVRIGVGKFLRMGLLFAGWRRGQALDISPKKRLKLSRQVAAAGGKKESVSFSDHGGE